MYSLESSLWGDSNEHIDAILMNAYNILQLLHSIEVNIRICQP